jgi:hypothetical protein
VPGSAVIKDGVLTHATVQTNTQIGREVSKPRLSEPDPGRQRRPGPTTNGRSAADLTYSRAYSNTPKPITRSRLIGPVGLVTFDYAKTGERLPDLDFTANLNDPNLLPGRRIEYRTNDSLDHEAGGQAGRRCVRSATPA